jgi:Domain of unknown function (DUF2017)
VKRRRGGPVKAAGSGFVIDLPDDESALVLRLVGELRTLLADPEPDSEVRLLLARLFPVVHPDDPDAEFEYQRLMREELVASKMAAFDLVDTMLATDGAAEVDEGRLMAFMQAINSIRLVLGTMLGVTDDPNADEVQLGAEDSPEYALYSYLSWLLEHCVRALQSR